MRGTSLSAYLSEESGSFVADLVGSSGPVSYETTGIKKDGTRLNLELSGKPYQHQGKSVRLTAIRDVTTRKQMEAQILMQDRLASVGLLASSLAHEIGTPLGVIRGGLNIWQSKLKMLLQSRKTWISSFLKLTVSPI